MKGIVEKYIIFDEYDVNTDAKEFRESGFIIGNKVAQPADDSKVNKDSELYKGLVELMSDESQLLDNREVIQGNTNTYLGQIDILSPIEYDDTAIFPVLYSFNDGRNILKFVYNFNDDNISNSDKKIDKIIYNPKISFLNSGIKNIEIDEKKSAISMNDTIDLYYKKLIDYSKSSANRNRLTQEFTNIVILDNEGQSEEELYLLSLPSDLETNKDKIDDLKIVQNNLSFFTNYTNNIVFDINNDSDYYSLEKGYQIPLEFSLRKKFAINKKSLQFYNGEKDEDNRLGNFKKNIEYTMADNQIAFSKDQKNLDLFEKMFAKIFPEENRKLITEIGTESNEYTQFKLNHEVNQFNRNIGLISCIALLITALLSYEAIKGTVYAFSNTSKNEGNESEDKRINKIYIIGCIFALLLLAYNYFK